MQEDVVQLKNKINLLSDQVDNYEEEIKRLRHIIKLFKEEKFGSKSES